MKTWQIILLIVLLVGVSAADVARNTTLSGNQTGSVDGDRQQKPPGQSTRSNFDWQKAIPSDATLPYAGQYALGYILKHGNIIYKVVGSPNGKTWKKIS